MRNVLCCRVSYSTTNGQTYRQTDRQTDRHGSFYNIDSFHAVRRIAMWLLRQFHLAKEFSPGLVTTTTQDTRMAYYPSKLVLVLLTSER